MGNLFRSKFTAIGMLLDILSASGKRRIFYAFETLVMLAISVLSVYGLQVLFTSTISENFLLFIFGVILAIAALVTIGLPVIIASIVLFFATLIGSFKGEEKGANAFSLIIVIIAIVLTIVFLSLILAP